MAKDRLLFLISFAFLGLIAAFLFQKPGSESRSERIENETVTEDGKKIESAVEVLIAKKALVVNERLKEGNYDWKVIDLRDFNPSLVMKTPQTEQWLKEAVLVSSVSRGAKIKNSDISLLGQVKIQPMLGKKAVPFDISSRPGIIQFMNPGMRIDIMFTSNSDIGFGGVSFNLFNDIRVLAIGRDADGKNYSSLGGNYKKNTPIEVLLEMTPRQAEIFSYAQSVGELSLEFRGIGIRKENSKMVKKLLASDSAESFHSVLVTYMVESLFPDIDVKITATPNGYIVSGKIPDPQKASKIMEILEKLAKDGDKAIVNLMEVEPQQVLLAVKVFELDKNVSRRLGVNWEALFEHASGSVAVGAVFPSPLSTDPNYFIEAIDLKYGDFTLSSLVDMMQENGIGRVLAEPNLTTISGQKAQFFAGGEFPILIPQGGTLAGTVTVEFKKFGVILEFTPTVELNGSITMHVVPEVSTIDKANSVTLSGFVIPSIINRRTDTFVKLWPGQSYILAGLLQSEYIHTHNHLYGLDRLPIIGPLFSSKSFTERRSELVFVVTPYLVNHTKPVMEPCEPGACSHAECDVCGCVHEGSTEIEVE